uniref:Uncharacterized protein n=2 Tax=Meloidogyne incognita group TaxID=654580 RepID=A0A915LVM1_MELJA
MSKEQSVQEVEQIDKASEEKVSTPVKQPALADAPKPDVGEESRDSVVSSVDNGVSEEDQDEVSQKSADDEKPAEVTTEDASKEHLSSDNGIADRSVKGNGHSAEEKSEVVTEVVAELNGNDAKNRKRSGPGDDLTHDEDQLQQKKKRVEDGEQEEKEAPAVAAE